MMISKIIAAINESNSFLITTHENPDGDAVGSSLALANHLVKLGKEVTVHYCDPVPDLYSFLPMADKVVLSIPPRQFDVSFVLDVGEVRRAGQEFAAFEHKGRIINLDHHLHCENFGEFNIIDPEAAATGILIYRVIKASGVDISYDTALCIYTAVVTDTGSFRYSNANPEAFSVASEMIGKGINAWDVSEKLYESQPRQRLELLSRALSKLFISDDGKYASLAVSLDMYEETGANAELTDGFVNYPRSIKGVEVAIFYREVKPQLFKVGFRSKGKVNVAAIAAAFGGGGHHNAAGCNVPGSLEQVKTIISNHLKSFL